MDIQEFLLARIAEDEETAQRLLVDLKEQIAEQDLDVADERGPFTPTRMLSAQLWAHYDGQTKRRSFARGQQIATLADPARILAECAAKRAIIMGAEAANQADAQLDYEVGVMKPFERPTGDRILSSLAAVYADHPDYQPEWSA